MKDKLNPFHLAIPVSNLEESVAYYRDTLGLREGRSSNKWADFDFFGHQLVCHVSDSINEQVTNPVDGEEVPVPHFGVVLSIEEFEEFLLQINDKNIDFIIKPTIRFKGEIGEQRTMFFKDPSGNAIEIKAFKDMSNLFSS
ncbi:MAG: glyoxalase [Gammaproteobacteria bacterium]|nr:MAG: glyoxalase [Gammaproteobacteria bacterium]